jgi:hypothetical protein
MKKFYIPSKDVTLYQAYPANNTGLDEILEIGKRIIPEDSGSLTAYESGSARSLLYFDLPTTESVATGSTYYLNLRLANATNVQRGQELLVYPISRSWTEGSGVFYQDVRNSNDGATWTTYSTSVSWSNAGGDFILNGSGSASVNLTAYPLEDLRIDVSSILRPIVDNNLHSSFYGLVVKFPTGDEISQDNVGLIQVFSSQTHTIHQPTLEVSWNNQSLVTGSLVAISSLDIKITPNNLQELYTKGDIDKIVLTVRDPYPLRSFDSTLRYKNKYYLPESSYYSIVDVQSNTTIVPFDNGSTISTDVSGSYITLDTSTLYSGRFYTLKIKVVSGSYSKVFNTETLFKVL